MCFMQTGSVIYVGKTCEYVEIPQSGFRYFAAKLEKCGCRQSSIVAKKDQWSGSIPTVFISLLGLYQMWPATHKTSRFLSWLGSWLRTWCWLVKPLGGPLFVSILSDWEGCLRTVQKTDSIYPKLLIVLGLASKYIGQENETWTHIWSKS